FFLPPYYCENERAFFIFFYSSIRVVSPLIISLLLLLSLIPFSVFVCFYPYFSGVDSYLLSLY
ncbi:uncharacterized protein BX664DRAFT_354387, partial [Halteromyces radiatus]|uniref:uncharacterized protein n=1 Tax=Halteromyces radiatus TaxID=101107 RepID=UPI00221FF88E